LKDLTPSEGGTISSFAFVFFGELFVDFPLEPFLGDVVFFGDAFEDVFVDLVFFLVVDSSEDEVEDEVELEESLDFFLFLYSSVRLEESEEELPEEEVPEELELLGDANSLM